MPSSRRAPRQQHVHFVGHALELLGERLDRGVHEEQVRPAAFRRLAPGGGRTLAHVLGKGVEADHEQLRVDGREVVGEPAVTRPDVDGRARVPRPERGEVGRGEHRSSGSCRPPASTTSAQRCSRPSASTRSYAWLRPIPGITRNACATSTRAHPVRATNATSRRAARRPRPRRAHRPMRPQEARSRACTRRAPSRRRSRSRAPPPRRTEIPRRSS